MVNNSEPTIQAAGNSFPERLHPAKLFPNAYSAAHISFCMLGDVLALQNYLRVLEQLELYEHCEVVRDVIIEKAKPAE